MKIECLWMGLLLCCLLGAVVRAQNSPPTPTTAPTSESRPRAGEIALEGRVITLGQGQFTLEVTAFVNPNGKRATLAKPKSKTILINNLPDLKIGEMVSVIGVNGGGTLKARVIARSAQKIIEAPVAVELTKKQFDQAKANLAAPWLPAFVAGDLTITPVQAGFDYSQNVFPGFRTFERTPVFTCTFRVESTDAKATTADIAQRIVLRRIVGPQNQFVEPFSLGRSATIVKDENGNPSNRAGFYSAGVDPNWEWIDMDLDTTSLQPPAAGEIGGKIELRNITLPEVGAEIPINREFTGALGTQFRVIKIRRDEKGQTFVVVHHQKPAAPADLEIASYSLGYSANKDDRKSSGGGGLMNGFSASGDNELSISSDKTLTSLDSLRIEMREKAPSLVNRARVTRQRLRFPLRRLRTIEKIAPVQIENAPVELGRAQSNDVEVRADSDGLSWSGSSVMLVMAAKSTPANAQRGLRWQIVGGKAHFDNGAPDAELQRTSSDMIYQWHSDATPLAPGETVEKKSLTIPSGAKSYDLKFDLEGRVTLDEWFARDLEIPQTKMVITPPDDGEHSLILRKIQRFSSPDELKNYPTWIRGQWPNAGLALVFEAHPLLINPEIFTNAFDAEDDQGRELKTGTLIEQSLYNIDMTQPANPQAKRFYTLIVGQPAPDAKRIKVWLHLKERASNIEKASLEMKHIAISKFDDK